MSPFEAHVSVTWGGNSNRKYSIIRSSLNARRGVRRVAKMDATRERKGNYQGTTSSSYPRSQGHTWIEHKPDQRSTITPVIYRTLRRKPIQARCNVQKIEGAMISPLENTVSVLIGKGDHLPSFTYLSSHLEVNCVSLRSRNGAGLI